MTMSAMIRKLETNPGSIRLEDAAKAFRVEAEAMASSPSNRRFSLMTVARKSAPDAPPSSLP